MAATVSGSKIVTTNASPQLTSGLLTTLMSTAVENLTIAQLKTILDATKRLPGAVIRPASLARLSNRTTGRFYTVRFGAFLL